MNHIILAENIEFQDILSYPHIEIMKSSITFLQGPSGSGKSTFFKLINATLSSTSGNLFINNKNVEQWDTLELRKFALIIGQTVYLFPGTILDNFKKFYSYREEPLISTEQMQYFLNLSVVKFPLDASCDTMSGGERQRVFIAICLSFQPKIILLDEVTSALDHDTAFTLWENLKNYSLTKDITIVAISHDQKLTETFATQIITIEKEVK